MDKQQISGFYQVVIAIWVLCLAAQVSVTLPSSQQGIPFTTQSLAVFIITGLFGIQKVLYIILGYLILGIIGLPVFADATGGVDKVFGASGGFLYGFLFSGLLISYMIGTKKRPELVPILIAMILGTIVLFGCGIGHLSYKFGLEKALEYGFYPFWKMGLFKALLAGAMILWIKRSPLAKIIT